MARIDRRECGKVEYIGTEEEAMAFFLGHLLRVLSLSPGEMERLLDLAQRWVDLREDL